MATPPHEAMGNLAIRRRRLAWMPSSHLFTLEERIWETRDYWSSFDSEATPSDYEHESGVFSRINAEERDADSAPTSWTVSGEQAVTSIQWACYDYQGHQLASNRLMQSLRDRASIFTQKIDTLFDRVILDYHEGSCTTVETVERLEDIIETVEVDQIHRRHETAADVADHDRQLRQCLIRNLHKITLCIQRPGQSPARPPQQSAAPGSLFRQLFVDQPVAGDDFMLDLLVQLSEATPPDWDQQQLFRITHQLQTRGARASYQQRFGTIVA